MTPRTLHRHAENVQEGLRQLYIQAESLGYTINKEPLKAAVYELEILKSKLIENGK